MEELTVFVVVTEVDSVEWVQATVKIVIITKNKENTIELKILIISAPVSPKDSIYLLQSKLIIFFLKSNCNLYMKRAL